MNYMKQVANMLGVEIGEEFKISDSRHRYKFNETGLIGYVCGSWVDQLCALTKILNGEYKIIKLPKALLIDEEKEYLSNVIKPFRDDVKCIIKNSVDYVEWITICMKTCHDMDFPIFSVGTMYKGMQLNKEYTLEELGL